MFKGYLYAATDDGWEVWRSSNGTDWTKVKQYPDLNWDYEGELIVFKGSLYHFMAKDTGAQIWRTSDGVIWEMIGQDGLGDANNIEFAPVVFNNNLYVSTINTVTGNEV